MNALLFVLNKGYAQPQFPPSASDSMINLNSSQWMLAMRSGNLNAAVDYSNNIVNLTNKEFGEISHSTAVALSYYLAYTYTLKEDYGNAHYFFKKAIGIYTVLKDTSVEQYKNAVFYYGMVCFSMGANTEAESWLKKAAALCKAKNDIPNYTQSVICTAAIFSARGEYAKAEEMDMNMKEVLEALPKTGFINYLLGSIYNNVAVIYAETGNPQKALQCMQKAEMIERIPETGVSGSDYVLILLNLADAYAMSGFADSALIKCRQAEDSLRLKKDNFLFAMLLKEKARICQLQNKLAEATLLFRGFKDRMDTMPVKPSDYDAGLLNLGMIYVDTKQYALADSLFRQEILQLRQSGRQYSFEMQQALAGLCANLTGMKKYNEASDSLLVLCHLAMDAVNKNFPGMSESDQLNYRTGLDAFFDLLYTCIEFGNTRKKELIADAFRMELQRKNLVLSSQVRLLNEIRSSKDSSLLERYNSWLNNRQILSRQYSLPASQRFFNTDSLEYIADQLEKQVSAKGLREGTNRNDLPIDSLLKTGENTVNIAFVRYNYKTGSNNAAKALYAAFIFRYGDTVPVFVPLCSEAALMQLMKDNNGRWIDKNQLTQKIYNQRGSGTGTLYRLIWKPIEPYLKGIESINYTTAGMFNNIALHAVHDGHSYLMNKYILHCYASLREVGNNIDTLQHQKEISIWGNMNYDSSVYANNTLPQSTSSLLGPGMKATSQSKKFSNSPLQPFSNNEIPALQKLFYLNHIPYKVFEQIHATEENFKEQAAHTNGVLHVSTHGFYDPLPYNVKENRSFQFNGTAINPLFRCGLAFSGVNYYWIKGRPKKDREDGILTGYEVAQLDLHKVALVTLSACETALGDITGNEGNLGLVRAFKLAGAQKLLVSLWEVPARQTAELLSLFYTYWLKGKTFAQALQLAENTMRKKNYPPYFWAGFVLIE
jgi:CHAT domain-containing protein/tetratricopeptide (TPR) repeat protein